MPDVAHLIDAGDPWIEIVRAGSTGNKGRCVLLWVQNAQRATMNRAANCAVSIGDHLGVPVVAGFALSPGYPSATWRSYHFMAEGLRELPDQFNARGIGWVLRVGTPEVVIPDLARELEAAIVVTDSSPLRTGRQWRQAVGARIDVPLLAVSSDTVAPPALFPKEEYAPRTLRPKLWRAMISAGLPSAIPDPQPRVRGALSALREGPDPVAAVADFSFSHAVLPAPRRRGGGGRARQRLDHFIAEQLAAYPDDRNRPERDGQSGLSPYLHFGQISPVEIALAAIAARAGDRPWVTPKGLLASGPGPAVDDAPLATLLDELITQRELAVNFCLRNPGYDRWEGLPGWGRATLLAHEGDPRPVTYTTRELELGETGDRLWNAAQRQLVHEGSMPNQMRMYWAKQLLFWTRDPREAFQIAIDLNDRYEIDGRDPNGYAGIAWSIGGRHDRPFPPNKPILGLIRPMTTKGLHRKFDVAAYIALVEGQTGAPVPPRQG